MPRKPPRTLHVILGCEAGGTSSEDARSLNKGFARRVYLNKRGKPVRLNFVGYGFCKPDSPHNMGKEEFLRDASAVVPTFGLTPSRIREGYYYRPELDLNLRIRDYYGKLGLRLPPIIWSRGAEEAYGVKLRRHIMDVVTKRLKLSEAK
jgi:hypothetical protein